MAADSEGPGRPDLVRAGALAALLATASAPIPEADRVVFAAEPKSSLVIDEATLKTLSMAIAAMKDASFRAMLQANGDLAFPALVSDADRPAFDLPPRGKESLIDMMDYAGALFLGILDCIDRVLTPLDASRSWRDGLINQHEALRMEWRVFDRRTLCSIAACFTAREADALILAGDDLGGGLDSMAWAPMRDAFMFGSIGASSQALLRERLWEETPIEDDVNLLPSAERIAAIRERLGALEHWIKSMRPLTLHVIAWRKRMNVEMIRNARPRSRGPVVTAPEPLPAHALLSRVLLFRQIFEEG